MTRAYIAGPMTGYRDHNLPAFFQAEATLRRLNFATENPGDNDGGTVAAAVVNAEKLGRSWADYLRIDITRLAKCDFVVVLPGWQKSRGANLEVDIAERLGMPIMCLRRDGAIDSPGEWRLVPRVQCIGLSGYARAGKDTVGRILGEQHGYARASFADKLRDLALYVDPLVQFRNNDSHRLRDVVNGIGWEDAKDAVPEVRRLLQAIGTGVRDIIGPDTWVNLAMRDLPDGSRIAFTDVRFMSEAEAIKAAGGEIWRINRPGCGPINGHISETALDDYPFDVIINNHRSLDYLTDAVSFVVDRSLVGAR